jgi:hypothetical protein
MRPAMFIRTWMLNLVRNGAHSSGGSGLIPKSQTLAAWCATVCPMRTRPVCNRARA